VAAGAGFGIISIWLTKKFSSIAISGHSKQLIERRLPTATINSSVRIVASCSFSFPHELRDEVWLPGPAPIIGGRFLEILGSGAYVRPNCAEQRDPAVK
jgi:hypothetical protein